jgi:hypothetical protein
MFFECYKNDRIETQGLRTKDRCFNILAPEVPTASIKPLLAHQNEECIEETGIISRHRTVRQTLPLETIYSDGNGEPLTYRKLYIKWKYIFTVRNDSLTSLNLKSPTP